ncbi:MAG: dihydrodipicolinate synthase family protein [Sarcina sp.]
MSKFDIKDFKGVIPALLTVFDKDEEIDEVGMRELVNYLLEKGVNGLYLTGSTGEGFTMSNEERKKVVEIVIDEVKGKVPVVVHVGAIGTKLSIDLAKHAKLAGADGISSVPPFYWKFNEDQIVKYYKDIAQSCDLPMIVYNVPLVGLLGMNTIKKLAEIETVKGIKYTALSHYEITQIKDEIGSEFLVYSGCDEMSMSGLLAGADGIVGSFFNLMPELFLKLFSAVENKNLDEAQTLQREAVEIIMYTLKLPSFYAGMKVILRHIGVNAGYCRNPFQNLTPEEELELIKGYKELKSKYNIKGADFLEKL